LARLCAIQKLKSEPPSPRAILGVDGRHYKGPLCVSGLSSSHHVVTCHSQCEFGLHRSDLTSRREFNCVYRKPMQNTLYKWVINNCNFTWTGWRNNTRWTPSRKTRQGQLRSTWGMSSVSRILNQRSTMQIWAFNPCFWHHPWLWDQHGNVLARWWIWEVSTHSLLVNHWLIRWDYMVHWPRGRANSGHWGLSATVWCGPRLKLHLGLNGKPITENFVSVPMSHYYIILVESSWLKKAIPGFWILRMVCFCVGVNLFLSSPSTHYLGPCPPKNKLNTPYLHPLLVVTQIHHVPLWALQSEMGSSSQSLMCGFCYPRMIFTDWDLSLHLHLPGIKPFKFLEMQSTNLWGHAVDAWRCTTSNPSCMGPLDPLCWRMLVKNRQRIFDLVDLLDLEIKPYNKSFLAEQITTI